MLRRGEKIFFNWDVYDILPVYVYCIYTGRIYFLFVLTDE